MVDFFLYFWLMSFFEKLIFFETGHLLNLIVRIKLKLYETK